MTSVCFTKVDGTAESSSSVSGEYRLFAFEPAHAALDCRFIQRIAMAYFFFAFTRVFGGPPVYAGGSTLTSGLATISEAGENMNSRHTGR